MKRYFWKLFYGFFMVVAVSGPAAAQYSTKNIVIDETLHYFLSTEVTFASCMFFTLKNPDIPLKKKYIISASIGMAAGVTKELSDLMKDGGTFDVLDLGIDVLGIGTGLLLHYCIFDKKASRNKVSLQVLDSGCLASVCFYF